MTIFDLPATERLIRQALEEDVGYGDVTSRLTVPTHARVRAEILAKEQAVIAGLPLVRKICSMVDPSIEGEELIDEGRHVVAGDILVKLRGNAHSLLAIERVALNLLQHLSGVATLTADYVQLVSGCGCRIVDTRKTLPGLRMLEKYAVRVGGGFNHRMGLDDGILIKDNHIIAAGGIAAAVAAAQAGAPHGLKVEVECTTMSEVSEALHAGAEMILLDNMTIEEIRDAVRRIAGRAVVEASGGISMESVRAVADTGVDIISVGKLTHSAPAVDLSMKLFAL